MSDGIEVWRLLIKCVHNGRLKRKENLVIKKSELKDIESSQHRGNNGFQILPVTAGNALILSAFIYDTTKMNVTIKQWINTVVCIF